MKSKRVIVAFTIGNTAGRESLSGVFNFVNAGHDWKISFLQNPYELTPETVDNAIRTGGQHYANAGFGSICRNPT